MKKSDKTQEVIIIQKTAYLPDGLREALGSRGFPTRIFQDEHEFLQGDFSEQKAMAILHCGKEGSCERSVASLSQLKMMHKFPIIVVGEDADQYESHLNKYFVLATTITTPCTSSDILAAVEYIIRYIERRAGQSSNKAKSETSMDPDLASQQAKALFQGFSSIPDLVFDKISQLGILEKKLGGNNYAMMVSPEKDTNRSYLPESFMVQNFVRDVLTNLDHSPRIGHFLRTSLLANLLLNAIGLDEVHVDSARIAAAMYSSSYLFQFRDLSLKDYLSPVNSDLRKELCSRVKDSAMQAASDGNPPMVSQIIASVARLIGKEEEPTDDPISLAASCIMAADLVDRFVYQSRAFNPIAAYFLLSKLKTEHSNEFHPLVLACIIKILAEAVTSNVTTLSIPAKLKALMKMKNAGMQLAAKPLGKDEVAVAVSSLTPGMQLSRPITTWDGKELLSEPIKLDEDLIWRLWQISALRPIDGDVVVRNEG